MDPEDRSAAVERMTAASFDPVGRWFGSGSVCTPLSTIFGVCHSGEEGIAALAADAPEEDESVTKCPMAIFSMALLNRPEGRYQWPLFPFFIWRCTRFPLGVISHPFSPRNHISPVRHRMTASIRRRASIPRRAGTSEPRMIAAL